MARYHEDTTLYIKELAQYGKYDELSKINWYSYPPDAPYWCFITAVKYGHYRIVQMMLERVRISQRNYALRLAVRRGHAVVVEKLLAARANIYAEDGAVVHMALNVTDCDIKKMIFDADIDGRFASLARLIKK